MKKGINKILILLITSALLLMPFSVFAETYINNVGVIGAYQHFINHGMSYSMKSNYDLLYTDNPSIYSISANNLRLNHYNNNETYRLYVKSSASNGQILGPYMGSQVNNGNMMLYYSSGNASIACTNCYIIYYDPTTSDDYFTNPNTINISNSVNFDNINGYLENGNLFSYVSGTYTNLNQYKGYDYLFLSRNILFSFACPSSVYNGSANAVKNSLIFNNPSSNTNSYSADVTRIALGGFNYYILEFTGSGDGWTTFDIGVLNGLNLDSIIPIYYGFKGNMPSDIYAMLYSNLDIERNSKIDRTNELLNTNNALTTQTNSLLSTLVNGNTSSNNSVSNLDNTNSNLNNAINDYDTIEQTLTNDLTSNLNNINTNFRLNSVTKFSSASNFVKNQFNKFMNIEPFNLLVTYSLTLGLAMLIIGKRLL